MVESIGPKLPPVSDYRIAPVAQTAATPQVTPSVSEEQAPAAAQTTAAQTAAELSTDAPVDTDRVARIKKAIAEGRFPISPATIADRLLALRMEWVSSDQA